MLDLMLQSVQVDRIRYAPITNNGVRAEAKATRGCNEAAAPVSKTVAIAFYGNRRICHQMIWTLQIGDAREVHVQHYNHWRRLWKLEAELTPDMDTHDVSIF